MIVLVIIFINDLAPLVPLAEGSLLKQVLKPFFGSNQIVGGWGFSFWFLRLTNRKDQLEAPYEQLIAAFLPEGTLEYFEVTQVQKGTKGLYIHLEERNLLPKEFQEQKDHVYHSKGFYPQVSIQDFPIRGQKVLLQVKRRRWESQKSGEILSRDWNLVQNNANPDRSIRLRKAERWYRQSIL